MTNQRSLLLFEHSIKSKETRKYYLYYLDKFKDHYNLSDYDSILTTATPKLQIMVEDYVMYLKKKLSPNTVPTQVIAIQSFLEINDVALNWKKIRKLFPAKVKLSGKKAWTTAEVQKMLSVTTDLRARALIHFLASTGVRVGAIPDIQMKHLGDMPLGCKSIIIYEGTTDEYTTFLTPEASRALDAYLEKRKHDGEQQNPENPVFRTIYEIGSARSRPLQKSSITSIMHRTLKKADLRNGKQSQRFETQMNHGFRKRFNTILKLNNEINSNIVEKLMGHKNGMDGVYLAPTKEELFEEFRKGINELTIDDSERLRIQNKKLQEEKSELEKSTSVIEKMQVTQNEHTVMQKLIIQVLKEKGFIIA